MSKDHAELQRVFPCRSVGSLRLFGAAVGDPDTTAVHLPLVGADRCRPSRGGSASVRRRLGAADAADKEDRAASADMGYITPPTRMTAARCVGCLR